MADVRIELASGAVGTDKLGKASEAVEGGEDLENAVILEGEKDQGTAELNGTVLGEEDSKMELEVKQEPAGELNGGHVEGEVIQNKYEIHSGCNGNGVNGMEHDCKESLQAEVPKPEIAISTKTATVLNLTPVAQKVKSKLVVDGNNFKSPFPVTPIITPKKSNLKRPKSLTPDSNALTPSKRIRIVVEEKVKEKPEIKEGQQATGEVEVKQEAAGPSTEGSFSSFTEEVEVCGEKIIWLHSGSSHVDQSAINVQFVRDNLQPTKKKFSVEIDMKFVLAETLASVIGSKTKIADLGSSDFHFWVCKNSPFADITLDCVHKENYLKLSNLDALLDFDLTSPKQFLTAEAGDADNLYYVGDIYHNSKGFQEYILSKTSQHVKQFSTKIFSWKAGGLQYHQLFNKTGILFESQLQIEARNSAKIPQENVESFGELDPEDLMDAGAIDHFVCLVEYRTKKAMLNVFIVDNPELSNVYESCREVRIQKYFYCQCLLALRCLREGGTFICKIFDTITQFTNGLMFLLHKCFKSITIHKPSSSSPYTPERFVICRGKVDNVSSRYVTDFLIDCFDMAVNTQKQMKIVRRKTKKRLAVLSMEVQTLVSLKQILRHAEFFEFIRSTNIRISQTLFESIDSLCQLMANKDQSKMNELVSSLKLANDGKLKLWNLCSGNSEDIQKEPLLQLKSFMDRNRLLDFVPNEEVLENLVAPEVFSLFKDQSFVAFPIQGTGYKCAFNKSRPGFFYGTGSSTILFYNGISWEPTALPEFWLPQGTLVVGEVVEELCKRGKGRAYLRFLHIFDGIFLHGVFLGSLSIIKRQAIIRRFLITLNNPSHKLNERCRVIGSLSVDELPTFLSNTSNFNAYPSALKTYRLCGDDTSLGIVGGFLLVKNYEDDTPESFIKNYKRTLLTLRQEEKEVIEKAEVIKDENEERVVTEKAEVSKEEKEERVVIEKVEVIKDEREAIKNDEVVVEKDDKVIKDAKEFIKEDEVVIEKEITGEEVIKS